MIEHIDIEIDNKFNFRFFKEGDDEWVCKLDTWLVKKAEELFQEADKILHSVQPLTQVRYYRALAEHKAVVGEGNARLEALRMAYNIAKEHQLLDQSFL